jgi:hypothetical protein
MISKSVHVARSHGAKSRKTEYLLVVAITLIAALVGGSFLGVPRALASSESSAHMPSGLRSDLVLARSYSVSAAAELAEARYYAQLNIPILANFAARSAWWAKYYAQLNIPIRAVMTRDYTQSDVPSVTASAARSAALAKYYAQLNVPYVTISAARSAALAKYYAQLNIP